MANGQYVSTAQVSQALGVSVTTVKRWVDRGILPAHRTAGGHRKLLRSDVLRIARAGNFPRQDLSRLGSAFEESGSLRQLSAQLLAALKQGRQSQVSGLLRDAYQSGVAVETLADAAIAPAMEQLGHQWESGRLTILEEHRGTLLCMGAVFHLQALRERSSSPKQPLALGGGPEGDPYLLANLLAQLVLADAGWEAINLGPNTPWASFHEAIRKFRPRLLWLSVSSLSDVTSFLHDYKQVYQDAVRMGTAVAVGGRALVAEVRGSMPYTTFGDGLTHLAAFARSLVSPPTQPRRGRPRRV